MASEREIHDYFYGLIGKREGDPADDYQAVLQSLVDQGMEVNYRPEEQAKHRPEMPFRGLKIVKDASGSIRGTVQAPAHERDANGYYTHEFLVIRDRVPGQPPFVGPFDWGWHDRGGGVPYLNPVAGEGGGGGGTGGGNTDDAAAIAALDARVDNLEAENTALRARVDRLEQGEGGDVDTTRLEARVAALERKVGRLRVQGPTASRTALGRHYHDVDLAVVDAPAKTKPEL